MQLCSFHMLVRLCSKFFKLGSPDSSVGKGPAYNAGDCGSIPGSGKSAGEGIGYTPVFSGFPCGSAGKESTCNVWDLGSIPGLGRSPGRGKGYLLQYSGLENSMDYIVRHDWVTFTFSVRDLRSRRDAAADAAEILSSTTKRWNGENWQMASSPSHHSKNLSHQLY